MENQQKNSAAVFRGQIRKPPNISQPHCGPGRRQHKADFAGKTASVTHNTPPKTSSPAPVRPGRLTIMPYFVGKCNRFRRFPADNRAESL